MKEKDLLKILKKEHDNSRYNNKVFEEINEESAYALGLIWVDGSLTIKNKEYGYWKFSFFNHDYETVSFIRNYLESFNKISKRAKINSYYFQLVVESKFLENLYKYGFEIKRAERIPPKISDKFIRDFIRGFFDARGHFFTQWKSDFPHPYFVTYGKNESMMNWLSFQLNNLNIITKKHKWVDKKGTEWTYLFINKYNLLKFICEIYRSQSSLSKLDATIIEGLSKYQNDHAEFKGTKLNILSFMKSLEG